MKASGAPRWLLLIHQIPPSPAYFRAKVGKRLAKLGAVAIKNSVYVIPDTEQTHEDLQWIAREIVAEGGDATMCRASFVEGLRDEQIEGLFNAAREADYNALAEDVRAVLSQTPSRVAALAEARATIESDVARIKKRLGEIAAIDYFGAPGREAVQATLEIIEKRLRREPKTRATKEEKKPARADYQGRTWVTRKNVHVDRIGSAWLIRRFIDPKATLKFVPGQGYQALSGEVTFDMYEATFTHVGDACTFEVLLDAFDLREVGLSAIAEIIHDIDVKDGKFERLEAPGVASLIAGIALSRAEDAERIALGSTFFDALYELFRRKRS